MFTTKNVQIRQFVVICPSFTPLRFPRWIAFCNMLFGYPHVSLNLSVPETKIAEFANSVDLDEVAHHEPPHLDLHRLLSGL